MNEQHDPVNTPRHYTVPASPLLVAVREVLAKEADTVNLECIEAMVSMLTIEEIKGFLRGNSFKYRWRYPFKNGLQDLKKAKWYEARLEEVEETIAQFYNTTNPLSL